MLLDLSRLSLAIEASTLKGRKRKATDTPPTITNVWDDLQSADEKYETNKPYDAHTAFFYDTLQREAFDAWVACLAWLAGFSTAIRNVQKGVAVTIEHIKEIKLHRCRLAVLLMHPDAQRVLMPTPKLFRSVADDDRDTAARTIEQLFLKDTNMLFDGPDKLMPLRRAYPTMQSDESWSLTRLGVESVITDAYVATTATAVEGRMQRAFELFGVTAQHPFVAFRGVPAGSRPWRTDTFLSISLDMEQTFDFMSVSADVNDTACCRYVVIVKPTVRFLPLTADMPFAVLDASGSETTRCMLGTFRNDDVERELASHIGLEMELAENEVVLAPAECKLEMIPPGDRGVAWLIDRLHDAFDAVDNTLNGESHKDAAESHLDSQKAIIRKACRDEIENRKGLRWLATVG